MIFLFLFYMSPAYRLPIYIVGLVTLLVSMVVFRRMWQYHGAEHKAANTYWEGYDINDMTALRQSSSISRDCGTTFVALLIVVSVLVAGILSVLSIPFLPPILAILIPGIAYQIHAAPTDAWIIKPIVKAAKIIQRLFVSEPSDEKLILASQTLAKLLELEQNIKV